MRRETVCGQPLGWSRTMQPSSSLRPEAAAVLGCGPSLPRFLTRLPNPEQHTWRRSTQVRALKHRAASLDARSGWCLTFTEEWKQNEQHWH